MLEKIRNKGIVSIVIGGTIGFLGTGLTSAFAVGVENTAVSGAFTQLTEDVVATMAPVAIAAVAIAAMLLAFRYGRKILTTVAK